jgi:hypothetical protein
MIFDDDLKFSNQQAVTAAAASSNAVDAGPLYTGNTGRNLGLGKGWFVYLRVDQSFTDSGSDSSVTVTLETDDAVLFPSPATIATLMTLPALAAANSKYGVKMPPAAAVPYERYLRLKYTPNNGDLSAGKVTAGLILNMPNWKAFPSAVSTGLD